MPRLTLDEYEELTEWWRDSRAYFEGDPVATPMIQPQVYHSMDDDIQPAVLQKFKAYDAMFKEHELKLKETELNANSFTSIYFEFFINIIEGLLIVSLTILLQQNQLRNKQPVIENQALLLMKMLVLATLV